GPPDRPTLAAAPGPQGGVAPAGALGGEAAALAAIAEASGAEAGSGDASLGVDVEPNEASEAPAPSATGDPAIASGTSTTADPSPAEEDPAVVDDAPR